MNQVVFMPEPRRTKALQHHIRKHMKLFFHRRQHHKHFGRNRGIRLENAGRQRRATHFVTSFWRTCWLSQWHFFSTAKPQSKFTAYFPSKQLANIHLWPNCTCKKSHNLNFLENRMGGVCHSPSKVLFFKNPLSAEVREVHSSFT